MLRVRRHRTKPGNSLAFFGRAPDGTGRKLAVRVGQGRFRVATMHESSVQNGKTLLERDLMRGDSSQGEQATIVSGSLDALR